MLNVNDLEKRWKKHKRKSYIPYMLLSLFFISLGYLFSINYFQGNNTQKVSSKENLYTELNTTDKVKDHTVLIPIERKVLKEEPQTKNVSNQEKAIISPSFNFMDRIKSDSMKNTKANTQQVALKKIEKKKIAEVKKVTPKKSTPNLAVDNSLKINRRNTQNDIQHVVTRFKQSNNPALSLFIAKKYYELQNYQLAYRYALITNDLNNNIEESWLIFAKTLVKLNQKKKAINVLQKYISTSHSQPAKTLLNNIRLGKLQ